MKTKYAFQGLKENMAKAISKDLGISTKVSIEIANFIRGKTTGEAKTILNRVLRKKQPIPFKRFTDGVGHRKGANIAAGRFPEKASEAFLAIIKQCEANAQAKGLSSELRIVHLVAQKGTNMFRHGRQRRRKYKRTHLEIVLEEMEPKKAEKKTAKEPVKKQTEKPSAKEETVKKETKKDVKPEPKQKADEKSAEKKPEAVKKEDVVVKEQQKKTTDSETTKKEDTLPKKDDDSNKKNSEDKK